MTRLPTSGQSGRIYYYFALGRLRDSLRTGAHGGGVNTALLRKSFWDAMQSLSECWRDTSTGKRYFEGFNN